MPPRRNKTSDVQQETLDSANAVKPSNMKLKKKNSGRKAYFGLTGRQYLILAFLGAIFSIVAVLFDYETFRKYISPSTSTSEISEKLSSANDTYGFDVENKVNLSTFIMILKLQLRFEVC